MWKGNPCGLAALFSGILLISFGCGSPALAAQSRGQRAHLEGATMIIEYNSTDQDLGIQFFLDSEGWRDLEISDPSGTTIFSTNASGSLQAEGGGSELFLEGDEPPVGEVSFKEFFDRFPVGTYRVSGHDSAGRSIDDKLVFNHEVPAGPKVVSPPQGSACPTGLSSPVVIAWDPVTKSAFGKPISIVGYEVIVEGVDTNFDVHIPASAGTSLTISPESLERGADYNFEVLAIAEGGNQTITSGCFSTAP